MFRHIAFSISFLLIILIVTGVLSWLREKTEKTEKGTVRLPKLFLLIGVVTTAFFLTIAVICAFSKDQFIASIVLFFFAALGASLIIARLNWEIKYDDDDFSYKNFWGIRHKYGYDEITGISGGGKDIKLFAGKRVLRIDELALGSNQFIHTVRNKYRLIHNGAALPKVKWGRFDLFNGHVENPGEFLFIYCLFFILLIGFMIFVAISFHPLSYDDLEYKTTSFTHYTIDDGDIRLYTKENDLYFAVTEYKDYAKNIETLKSNSGGETVFEIYFQKLEPDNEDPYYDIASLRDQKGNVFLTLSQTNAGIRKNMLQVEILFSGFLLFWIVFTGGSIAVGRHPEKYSKRFIRLFFQDGYVHGGGAANDRKKHPKKKKS